MHDRQRAFAHGCEGIAGARVETVRVDTVADGIAEVTGRRPELSTSGGTSDARFIKDYCPVVEFGLVGQTMHQIDERVPVADLTTLTAVYRKILGRYFAP